jgi:Lrp/AsnC family transcriptional regulator, leucine-responsive regulatory protein
LDKIDVRILKALEEDARRSFAELGQSVGLSKTPCWQRVRALEREGIIKGYRTELDANRLGLNVHAFVHITIHPAKYDEFEGAVLRHPAILQCFTTAGQADYLVHVLAAGITELDHLLRMHIARLPGVQRIETTICMKTIKERAPLMGCLAAT